MRMFYVHYIHRYIIEQELLYDLCLFPLFSLRLAGDWFGSSLFCLLEPRQILSNLQSLSV